MIIQNRSYVRNKYVDYDNCFEFCIPQFNVNDYDILIVASGISNGNLVEVLDNIEENYSKQVKDLNWQTTVQFINDDIKWLNENLCKPSQKL